jgi:hypothetical protein
MSSLSRTALSQSFQNNLPNNNTGQITPFKLRAELNNIMDSAIFPEDSGSRYLTTASFHEFTASRVDTLTVVTGSYAVTASNIFIGDQTITGSLAVTGSSHTIVGNLTSSGNISSSGEVSAVSGAFNTADIDSGTFDQISSLTAANDLDIGDFDFRALTLTADSLTEGSVVLVGTDGILTEDTDITFTGDTLSVTKITNVDTTHVTASGNISASGDAFGVTGSFKHITASFIEANGFISNGRQFARFISGSLELGSTGSKLEIFGKAIRIGSGTLQPITASADVSISGDISSISGSFDHVTTSTLGVVTIYNVNTTNVTASLVSASNTVFGITGSFDHVTTSTLDVTTIANVNTTNVTASLVSASNTVFGITGSFDHIQSSTLDVTTIVNVSTTNITASNNISSSGEIEANKFISNGVDIAQFAASAVQLGGGILQPTILSGTDITLGISGQNQPVTVPSNLTVSGNISGSASSTGSAGSLKISGESIDFTNLPTSDPGVVGRLYRDGSGNVKISI